MHNDVFVFEKDWAMKIKGFIENAPGAGIVGLYGAKKIRKDSCGSTRKDIVGENKVCDEARKQFVEIWKDYLPADVTTCRERMGHIFI